MFGERRKQLLRYLLRNKSGASVDELAQSARSEARRRTAASGVADARSGSSPPARRALHGGRPQQLFVLTRGGQRGVPASLLLVRAPAGRGNQRTSMARRGCARGSGASQRRSSRQLQQRASGRPGRGRREKVEQLSAVMGVSSATTRAPGKVSGRRAHHRGGQLHLP